MSIKNEKIEKTVENRLKTMFKTTFNLLGLQYLSKLCKSFTCIFSFFIGADGISKINLYQITILLGYFIEVAKILFTFVLWKLLDKGKLPKIFRLR